MPDLSFNKRRIIVGIVWATAIVGLLNYLLDLGILGPYPKHMMIAGFVALAVALRYVGPTLADLREFRKRNG